MNSDRAIGLWDDWFQCHLAVRMGLASWADVDRAAALRGHQQPRARIIDTLCELCRIPPLARCRLTEMARSMRLGAVGLRNGYWTLAELTEALAIQERSHPRPLLGEVLVALRVISRSKLSRAIELQERELSSAILDRRTLRDRRRRSWSSSRRLAAGRAPATRTVPPWLRYGAAVSALMLFSGASIWWCAAPPAPAPVPAADPTIESRSRDAALAGPARRREPPAEARPSDSAARFPRREPLATFLDRAETPIPPSRGPQATGCGRHAAPAQPAPRSDTVMRQGSDGPGGRGRMIFTSDSAHPERGRSNVPRAAASPFRPPTAFGAPLTGLGEASLYEGGAHSGGLHRDAPLHFPAVKVSGGAP